MDPKELILAKIKKEFSDSIIEITDINNDLSVTIKKEQIISLAAFIKDDPELQFVMCKDVTAIDWATRKNRFTVVYHVYSFNLNYTIRIKCILENEPYEIESVSAILPSSNWYERETFDMYGIHFLNHPDLRRMYMPEGFEYHPLRKDFPVLGIPGSLPLPNKPE